MIFHVLRLYFLRWFPGAATNKLRALLSKHSATKQSEADIVQAEQLAQKVKRAARLVLRSRCLDQSLLLCQLLRDKGVDARLKIGVRRDQQLPRAHAWVEVASVAIGEDAQQLQQFLPLAQAHNTKGFD